MWSWCIMSNVKYYRVRVKTLKELTRGESDPPDEYTNDEDEVYQLIEKYGGRNLQVWCEKTDIERFYSEKVNDDEELSISMDERFFYQSELDFHTEGRIKLDDDLFEL